MRFVSLLRIFLPRTALVVVAGWIGFAAPPAVAQQDDVLTVVLEEGQTLRGLAETHLGDPDLWPQILRASNLTSITEVRPGVRLRIPVSQIAGADRALEAAKERIQAATKAGARLFAPDLIANAIRLHDQALVQRKNGAWDPTRSLAEEAWNEAQRALNRSLDERNVSAEAVISDRIGTVQGRTPSELTWSERGLRSVLVEEERVRTLTGSFAEIMFRDESRLRLNANSQAVIERMRVDLLDRQQTANVSLVEGDLYAMLGGNRARKSFDLDVPGVETEFESTNFWVGRQGNRSRFANYDDQAIRVTSGGSQVTLNRNQGTLVDFLSAPTAPRQLLPQATAVAPEDDRTIFQAEVTLQWMPVAGAVGYWVEIGTDRRFFDTVRNEWGVRDTTITLDDLEDGTYYWQVAAIDDLDFPGAKSDVRRFTIKNTERPPYLTLYAPADNLFVRDSSIVVSGETEAGVQLTLNAQDVATDAGGAFEQAVTLDTGPNLLVVEAVDEKGEATRRMRTVTFLPDEEAEIRLDMDMPEVGPNRYVTSGDGFTVAGETSRSSAVRIASATTQTSTFTDTTGAFQLSVRMREEEENYNVRVTTPSGFATESAFSVTSDRSAPHLVLDEAVPAVTATPQFALRGRVVDGTRAELNGRPLTLNEGRFEEVLTWTPGLNAVVLRTEDVAGNVQVQSYQVLLDRDPPRLDRVDLTPRQAAGGETVTLEVFASDVSGMQRAAPFELQVGSWSTVGLLRLSASTQSFRAVVNLPLEARGPLQLLHVTLSDYYGNARRYDTP